MTCPIRILYKALPRNACLDEGTEDCMDHSVVSVISSIKAHRCMEQTCYAVGSCLMEPCDGIRHKHSLDNLQSIVRPCEKAQVTDSLLCAYLSLDDYSLYYETYDPSMNIPDCWKGLEVSLQQHPEAYSSLRVWEQIGYTEHHKEATSSYDRAYQLIVGNSIPWSV